MVNPINLSNPIDPNPANKAQSTQQIAQQANADLEKMHGQGGPGTHAEKVTAPESAEKSYRSHFRHMKAPEEAIRLQRMMREVEMQEQIDKTAQKDKTKISKGEELAHKRLSKDDKKREKNPKDKKKESEKEEAS